MITCFTFVGTFKVERKEVGKRNGNGTNTVIHSLTEYIEIYTDRHADRCKGRHIDRQGQTHRHRQT